MLYELNMNIMQPAFIEHRLCTLHVLSASQELSDGTLEPLTRRGFFHIHI